MRNKRFLPLLFQQARLSKKSTIPRPYITFRIDGTEAPNESVALHKFNDKIISLGEDPVNYSNTCSMEAGGWQCQAVKSDTASGELGLTFPGEEGTAF